MLKRFFQIAALITLCFLLVYAPEIFTAVSDPYAVSTSDRTLLRIVLSTADSESASSFYDRLSGFRKSHPAYHLRVNRADLDQLLALEPPLPDVYLFSCDDETLWTLPLQRLFQPLHPSNSSSAESVLVLPFIPQSGAPLFCAVSLHSTQSPAALELVSYLSEASAASVSLEF